MIKRIYIAGPMRGLDDNNYPAFNAAAERLRADGWEVLNPVEIGAEFGTPYELATNHDLLDSLMRKELELIGTCSHIYLLKGWEKSVGAVGELGRAICCDCEIVLEP